MLLGGCTAEDSQIPCQFKAICQLHYTRHHHPKAPSGGKQRHGSSARLHRGAHWAVPPTNTAAEMAMHRWPAAPKAAPASALMVASGNASGSTTAWFLAPAFACHSSALRPTAHLEVLGHHRISSSTCLGRKPQTVAASWKGDGALHCQMSQTISPAASYPCYQAPVGWAFPVQQENQASTLYVPAPEHQAT